MNGLLSLNSADVADRLSRVPEPWQSIVAPHITHAATSGCYLDSISGALLVGHEPQAGALSFQIRLFPPATEELVERFEENRQILIPPSYRQMLSAFNGAFFYQLSLYGIDEFLLAPSPLPRASNWRSADIWASSAIAGPQRMLVTGPRVNIGARNVALDEVVTYSEQPDASVIAMGNGGVTETWPTLTA